MSKTVFTIVVPEGNIRKKQAPPAKAHKDKNAYNREAKHKKKWQEQASGPDKAPESSGAFLRLIFRYGRVRRLLVRGVKASGATRSLGKR